MLIRGLLTITVVASLELSGACGASAMRAELQMKQYAVISDTTGSQGDVLLLEYDLPDSLAAARIIHAQLTGGIEAVVGGGRPAARVEALPLGHEWDEDTVTWTYPWTTPGGDLDTLAVRSVLAREGEQTIRVDVTGLVSDWLDGSRPNHGIALRVARRYEGTFSLPTDQGEDPVIPDLRVWYLDPD
jgi:hypothetical protein